MRHAPWLAMVLSCGVSPVGVSAQDVEMLGQRYGTRPPPSYYDEMVQDAAAFEFERGWSRQLQAQMTTPRFGPGGPSLTLGPRSGPVVGTFLIPVLLGMYSNSGATPPFPRETIETAYFGAQPGTITDYYAEVSGGLVTLFGDVGDWQRVSVADTIVTDGESGLMGAPLGGGGAANFVYELLTMQVGVDWGLYDNDGPDGISNSGDDDGFVDVVAVIHPTAGGECGGPNSPDRIWSHRWSLSAAVDTTFVTTTGRVGAPGFIKVDDYVIQPSLSCSGGALSPIGVFTHELGHAFGLPDLYDTDTSNGKHAGAGNWELMASGSWGCDNASPSTPCHMGAWSKEVLG